MSGRISVGRRGDNLIHPTPHATILYVDDTSEEVSATATSRSMDVTDISDDESDLGSNHLMISGQLGICNDPYCTTCPAYYSFNEKQKRKSKFHLYGNAKGWAKKSFSSVQSYIPGVINPHTKIVQNWNTFFVLSCLVAIFLDPLFLFMRYVEPNANCVVTDWRLIKVFVAVRSVTDFIYLLHILLQFRLAYIAPESTVVGTGDFVSHPKKIALHYLSGYFPVDLFSVLPLPQILLLFVLPRFLGSSEAGFGKNFLRVSILIQYIPRLSRFLPILAGQSTDSLVFESAGTNIGINLLIFVLSAHVVGTFWYLIGLQRVNECLRDACWTSGIPMCYDFLDCEYQAQSSNPALSQWTNYVNASECLGLNGNFNYGVFFQTVGLTTESSLVSRYAYSLFFGSLQVATLAGNQVPSYFIWELIFLMCIIFVSLLLFSLLFGTMQSFLQELVRRSLEMTIRRRDLEKWMAHRRLPENLRWYAREAERYCWAATRGVNEEMLLESLPEDLQRDIRRHIFKFVKNVRIFSLMDECVLDSICERLRQKIYIKGSKVLDRNDSVEKMIFIVRGKMESVGEDGSRIPLAEGDVCGEELLAWCLEHSALCKDTKKIRMGQRLISNRTVICLTNVEAFTLREADIGEVTNLFRRFLRNTRVQGAIRYESPFWRGIAARRIQVAWKYRKKCLSRQGTSKSLTRQNSEII